MCRILRAGCRSPTSPEPRAWDFGAEVYPRDWFLNESVAWATMSDTAHARSADLNPARPDVVEQPTD